VSLLFEGPNGAECEPIRVSMNMSFGCDISELLLSLAVPPIRESIVDRVEAQHVFFCQINAS
jgi:hypothetical protein